LLVAIKQGLKLAHRLGDHVFVDEQAQTRVMEELSAAISQAVCRRAENDPQTITQLSRQIVSRLSRDSDLCTQLCTGDLKPDEFVSNHLVKDLSLGASTSLQSIDAIIEADNEEQSVKAASENPSGMDGAQDTAKVRN